MLCRGLFWSSWQWLDSLLLPCAVDASNLTIDFYHINYINNVSQYIHVTVNDIDSSNHHCGCCHWQLVVCAVSAA